MSILRLVLALTLCCATHAETTKSAKIEEIFRLTKVDQMQKTMMNQMIAMLPAQMKQMGIPDNAQAAESTKEMMNMVMDEMSWDKMKVSFIKIYDETFSEDEISGLLMFYESPAGKAFIAKSPELMTKTMAIAQERMVKLMPKIQERAKKMAEKAHQ